MLIEGRWAARPSGVLIPVVRARVWLDDARVVERPFLVDIEADRTVFCCETLDMLGIPRQSSPERRVAGVGGEVAVATLEAALIFARRDGSTAHITGTFVAFTEPREDDEDILGRDVLNNFDVIVSYPRREVLLLAGTHRYEVVG